MFAGRSFSTRGSSALRSLCSAFQKERQTLRHLRRKLAQLRIKMNLMTTDFFASMSFTVMLLLAASRELTVPAILRNVPEITSSAVSSLPSALRLPRARNWSPALIWSIVPFCCVGKFHRVR